MRCTPGWFIAAAALSLARPVVAQEALLPEEVDPPEVTAPPPPKPTPARPTVGLALSGGGVLGMAHVGMLRALEDLHIPVDQIAGTSMGGLIGALYATGRRPEEIERMVLEADLGDTTAYDRRDMSMRRKRDDFVLSPVLTVGIEGRKFVLPRGLNEGHKENLLLKRLTLPTVDVDDFSQLPIPFRTVAVDAATGEEVTLESGDLATAMRATMSIPGVYAPVRIDGRSLIDGGVADNLPIDDVRDMGADVIIASWVDLPGGDGDMLGLSSSTIFSMMDRNSLRQIDTLTDRDALVRLDPPPELRGDYKNAPELFRYGYEATMAQLKDRTDLQLSEAEWQAWRDSVNAPTWMMPVIDTLDLDNQSRFDDRIIEEALAHHLGKPLDIDLLERDLDRLFGLYAFEWINYDLICTYDHTALRIELREKSWGPHYISAGLRGMGEVDGETDVMITLSHRWLPIDKRGGEWRSDIMLGDRQGISTELYQPLTMDMRLFVAGVAEVNRYVFNLDYERITEVNAQTRFDLGVAPTNNLELRVGPRLAFQRTVIDSPFSDEDPEAPVDQWAFEYTYIEPQLYVDMAFTVRHDRLDQAWFPRHGTLLYGTAGLWRLELVGDVEPESPLLSGEVYGRGLAVTSLRRHSFEVYGEAGTLLPDSQRDVVAYRLGGPFRGDGIPPNALYGTTLGFTRLAYRYQVLANPLPVYLGLTAQGGALSYWADDWVDLFVAGSAFVGARTPVGPLLFNVGYSNLTPEFVPLSKPALPTVTILLAPTI
ncbi:MAG: patatin-like phospholipase family protein [Alphaproteobacteria bacterium]|nr:patatin-like phospholipase family protein [Alphaproteobacteria bacterium]